MIFHTPCPAISQKVSGIRGHRIKNQEGKKIIERRGKKTTETDSPMILELPAITSKIT